MIIEKTKTDSCGYEIDLKDFVAESELTVTITLKEYRDLIKTSVESKAKDAKLNWYEQYERANQAEKRIKNLEEEVSSLYKRLANCGVEPREEDEDE